MYLQRSPWSKNTQEQRLTTSTPRFLATAITVLSVPKSTPTTLIFAVFVAYRSVLQKRKESRIWRLLRQSFSHQPLLLRNQGAIDEGCTKFRIIVVHCTYLLAVSRNFRTARLVLGQSGLELSSEQSRGRQFCYTRATLCTHDEKRVRFALYSL